MNIIRCQISQQNISKTALTVHHNQGCKGSSKATEQLLWFITWTKLKIKTLQSYQ